MSHRVARGLATAMAVARVAIGTSTVLNPRRLAETWTGDGDGTVVPIFGRATGGRDLLLGVGALLDLSRGRSGTSWLAAGGVADAIDGGATVLMWRRLPSRNRWLFALAAGGTAVASAAICVFLPPDD
jgi:hypothetical protein